MKYLETEITLLEIPEHITLCINLTNCPNSCEGCHSPHLKEDIGKELNIDTLFDLIDNNEGITCVSFMGGDSNPIIINHLASKIKSKYSNLKVAWYSGKEEISLKIDLKNFDYIKIGPYIEELGPLTKKTTNQRLYQIINKNLKLELLDITNKFWNDKICN